jgi:hypothetical protein
MNEDDPPARKRADVGYRRPPAEHRFSRENQPKRRRRSAKMHEETETVARLLSRVLSEERRAEVGTQVKWLRMSEILILKAFELAERGSPIMRRRLIDLGLRNQPPGGEEGAIYIDLNGVKALIS